MAREVDSKSCDAIVIMGTAGAGAMLPCRSWGNGSCLRELRAEAGIPNVSIMRGTCKADLDEGIDQPLSPSKLIDEIRASNTSIGTNLVLDEWLGENPDKNKN